jgi:hypothetical protein
MTAPPVRRLVATAGLLVLAPVGVMLVLGAVSPEDAAVRSAATLVVCLVVARALSAALRSLASVAPVRQPGQVATGGEGSAAQRGNASSAASMTTGSNAEPAP